MNKYLAIGAAILLAGCGGKKEEPSKPAFVPAKPYEEVYTGQPISVTYSTETHRLQNDVYVVLQKEEKQELVIIPSGAIVNGISRNTPGIAALLLAEQNDGDDDLVKITITPKDERWDYEVTTGIKPQPEKAAEAKQ